MGGFVLIIKFKSAQMKAIATSSILFFEMLSLPVGATTQDTIQKLLEGEDIVPTSEKFNSFVDNIQATRGAKGAKKWE
jgi:hypothetical protein